MSIDKLLLIGFFFISFLGRCQEWPKTFFTNQSIYPYDILETYDHGFLIGGGIYLNSSVGSGLVFKTDINGELLWYHVIGSISDGTIVTGVDQTLENGIIAIGYTEVIPDQWNPFIIKFDACGEKEWCHLYPSANNLGWGRAIKALPDSSYIALIVQYGDDIEEKRVWLFRLDQYGDFIWQKYYGQTDSLLFNEWGNDLVVTKDSSIIVTGDCYYPEPGQTGGWHRPYIFKTNLDGDLNWEIPWTNEEFFIGYSYRSIVDDHGRIFSTCRHSRSSPPYGASPTLICTDSSGQEQGYVDLIPDSYLAAATTINWLQDSTIVFGGGWTMPNGPMNEAVFRVDTLGNLINSKVLYIDENSFIDAQSTFNNKIALIAGLFINDNWNTVLYKIDNNLEFDSVNTSVINYDTICPHWILSDTIPLDCNLIVKLENLLIDTNRTLLRVYPNPAIDHITVDFPKIIKLFDDKSKINIGTFYHKWDGAELIITSIEGKEMYRKIVNSNMDNLVVDVSTWIPEMYLIRLIFKNRIVGQAKIIISKV